MDYNYHGVVVVMDLDDTLFRERDFCRSGFNWIENKICRELGKEFMGLSKRMETRLRKRENYFELLEEILKYKLIDRFGDENILKDYMAEVVGGYRSHTPDFLNLANGVRGVMDELQRLGVVMAIITDGRGVTQTSKIRSLGLDRYLSPENIYISEMRGVDKSCPDSFQDIVRRYPEAKGFIYVGDNERKDFMMPNLLGWKTLKTVYDSDNVLPDFESDDILQAPTIRMSDFRDLLTEIQG